MSRDQDDFEDSTYSLDRAEETIDGPNLEEIETPSSKASISKKAAKKRDARRRIEDYLEMKRVKEVIEDFEEDDVKVDAWNFYDEALGSDALLDKK